MVAGDGGAEAGGAGVLEIAQPLFVGARRFGEEEIPLRKGLGDLRRGDDPVRAEQARELWALLGTWRPVDGGHTERLRYPVVGARRSAGFGDRRLYRYDDGATDRSIHNGVDLAARRERWCAVRGGTVVMAGFASSRVTVVIEHLAGRCTRCITLSRLNVGSRRVDRGMALVRVGSTGLATGPHLHWEVRAGGVAVDPDVCHNTVVDIRTIWLPISR